ncbi:MAG: UDP-N-acetylmuramate dehydrogenase [Eubacteriaceae bacterium]|nr:UDP-N-acetylmuramate dehydrogenase [Eubacteriaceae bacterium]
MFEKLHIIPGLTVRINEHMSKHTSFKTGGLADIYLLPTSKSSLLSCIRVLKEEGVPFYVIGNATNIVVSDEGIQGAVISTRKMGAISIDGQRMHAESGASLKSMSMRALESSLSKMEWAFGIPGSVGGAVSMNAGAYGTEAKDVVESVEVLGPNMETSILLNEQMDFGYRASAVFDKGLLVLSATFLLEKAPQNKIKELMDTLSEARRSRQPIELPSAGSVFKRPKEEGMYAAKLIEDAGLKGCQIGGAMVSPKHSGFIVNVGNATTNDIARLVDHVQKTVFEKFQIELETEIKFIGRAQANSR